MRVVPAKAGTQGQASRPQPRAPASAGATRNNPPRSRRLSGELKGAGRGEKGADLVRVFDTGAALDTGGNIDRGGARNANGLGQ
jgi:hypothetical protein